MSSGNVRVNQSTFEVVGVPGVEVVNLRVNQSVFEVVGILSTATSNIRANQMTWEVVGPQISRLRANQSVFEVVGTQLLTQAFTVTESGNLEMDTTSEIHLESGSTVLVDSGAWLRVHNSALLTLAEGTACFFTQYGQFNAIGASTLTTSHAAIIVTEGTVNLGETTGSTASMVLGNGSESAALNVFGTFSVDDTSSVVLGTVDAVTGPAILTVGASAELTLVNADFSLIGVLDIEDFDIGIVGIVDGDGVMTTGGVLANFTAAEEGGGGVAHCLFFTDTSYEPVTVGWAWTFGDGVTSGLQNPVHGYAGPGTYVVTLTILASTGSSTVTKTLTVS